MDYSSFASSDDLIPSQTRWYSKYYMYTVFENYKKFAFNIASEASYDYILSGEKFIKNVKNSSFTSVGAF